MKLNTRNRLICSSILASALVLLSTTAIAAVPSACSPCLWYAGDFDPGNPIAAFFLNGNSTWEHKDAQVWVPFIPASDGNPLHKHVLITAVTFNELTTTPDTNPPADFGAMTYGFRTGVISGNGGHLGVHGPCPATTIIYTGDSPYVGYNEFSYTCILTTKTIKVPVGTITWVNVLPTFTVSSEAFLSDAVDVPPNNQLGWSDDFYNSFVFSNIYGCNFTPATFACGNRGGPPAGSSMSAVAIAGTYVP